MQNTMERQVELNTYNPFAAVGFGPIQEAPRVARLRAELKQILIQMTHELPESLRAEAQHALFGFTDGECFRQLYAPIWSFLHWVPEAMGIKADAALTHSARQAHTMSLFLHIWDNELSEQPGPVNLTWLHVRTLAWQRFASESRLLCELVGSDPRLLETHANAYLGSLHQPRQPQNLEQYCQRIQQQVSLRTLVPRLLGTDAGGWRTATALVRIIEHFSVAWRLLEDIQNIHVDLWKGTKSAVWIELNERGKRLWSACRFGSHAYTKPDAKAWEELAKNIRVSGCLKRLLGLIHFNLQSAASIAASHGWQGIVQELEQCREGLQVRIQ